MTKRLVRSLCCCLPLLAVCLSAQAQEILKWRQGLNVTPQPRVLVDPLNGNDVADENANLGGNWPFSSVLKTFTNDNATLRTNFKNTFSQYLSTSLHPAVSQPSSPHINLYTYLKPYQYKQSEFINWMTANRGRTDFVEPLARRVNDWKGDLITPLVSSEAAITEDILKKTQGILAVCNKDYVTMIVDNRYNPFRFMAPVNEIHHKEQASLAYNIYAADTMWNNTVGIFNQWKAGNETTHVYLDYSIELTVEDYRSTYNEYDIWGIYNSVHPSASDNLNGVQHWNAYIYGNGASSQGQSIGTPAKEAIIQYENTRLIPGSIQVSLMVNWLEDPTHFRDSEWMVASKNYNSSIYYPPAGSTIGFKPTINDALNPWIKEGGCSGNVGWHRHPLSLLSDPIFTNMAPQYAPVVAGGGTWAIPDGNASNTVWGRIDLTKYYILSRGHTFFPGQKAWWGDHYTGFAVDNPNESHGIKWIGVIIENHSMHKVKAKVNTFYVWAQ